MSDEPPTVDVIRPKPIELIERHYYEEMKDHWLRQRERAEALEPEVYRLRARNAKLERLREALLSVQGELMHVPFISGLFYELAACDTEKVE